MNAGILGEALELIEKANANLQPELMTSEDARSLMRLYSKVERLAAYGVAALSRKVTDEAEVASVTGTSVGKARTVVATGQTMAKAPELASALQGGTISLDQAAHIASAEESAPGSAAGLIEVAKSESFHVLRDKARKTKLEAEQHRGLAERQRKARAARTYSDELGMVHIHLQLEPLVGTPIVARAEADAQRLSRASKADEREPFERYLADAYAAMLQGEGKGRARRPELVVLVDYEVARRGWRDVRNGEVCKVPGVGPIAPQMAKAIAEEAFISAVIYDGRDLRQLKRWTRYIPPELLVALELGDAPEFDGVKCVDCGNRFRTEFDHVHPKAAGGPTAHRNLKPRCWPCHQAKTERDRRQGLLRS